jgi:hypothetical protein
MLRIDRSGATVAVTPSADWPGEYQVDIYSIHGAHTTIPGRGWGTIGRWDRFHTLKDEDGSIATYELTDSGVDHLRTCSFPESTPWGRKTRIVSPCGKYYLQPLESGQWALYGRSGLIQGGFERAEFSETLDGKSLLLTGAGLRDPSGVLSIYQIREEE